MATKTFNTRIKNKYGTLDSFNQSNIVLMQGELAFVTDNDVQMIYLGDGITPFKELTPIFSTAYIVGIDKMNMEEVKLQPSAWNDKMQSVEVKGVSQLETTQLVIPTFSQASRQAALSAGIDYYVSNANEITFTCINVPTDIITVYVSIFGAKNNDSEDAPVIRTPIDDILSTESTNPVQNKVITAKITSLESTINSITGGDGTGDTTSLSSLDTKITNATTYKLNEKVKIGTYNNKDNYRQLIDYSLYVSSEVMEPNSDLGMIEVTGPQVTFTELTQAYWCGKTASGDFFGNFPVRVTSDKKVHLVNVPVSTNQYYLEGYIVFEGTDFSITGV